MFLERFTNVSIVDLNEILEKNGHFIAKMYRDLVAVSSKDLF